MVEKKHRNTSKISVPTEHSDQLIGKPSHRKGNIKHIAFSTLKPNPGGFLEEKQHIPHKVLPVTIYIRV